MGLDSNGIKLERRVYLSFVGIVTYMAVTWGYGGYIHYSFNVAGPPQKLDFSGQIRSPLPAMACMCLWGFADSFVQVWSYWVMTQLTQEPEELTCLGAFYKLWQNVGSLTAFFLSLAFGSLSVDFWSNIIIMIILVPTTILAIRRMNFSMHTAKTSVSNDDENPHSIESGPCNGKSVTACKSDAQA